MKGEGSEPNIYMLPPKLLYVSLWTEMTEKGFVNAVFCGLFHAE